MVKHRYNVQTKLSLLLTLLAAFALLLLSDGLPAKEQVEIPDANPPEIKVTTPITNAVAGQELTIATEVTDAETQVTSVILYYQVGGGVVAFMQMALSGNSTYTAVIPAADVTNKGLSYYIWAEDDMGNNTTDMYKFHDGNWVQFANKNTPQNVTVAGAVILPAGTLPIFDYFSPSKYRMLSAPIDASPNSMDLLAPFGVAGWDWKAWKLDNGNENNGYQPGHTEPFAFAPGVAAWVGTVNPENELMVIGSTLDVTKPAEIALKRGWNHISNPFNFSRNWDATTISVKNVGDINEAAELKVVSNVIYWFTGETSAYSFASADATLPNQTVSASFWTGVGIPSNDEVWKGWPGTLDPWGGYSLYAYKDATLLIAPTSPTKGSLPQPPK